MRTVFFFVFWFRDACIYNYHGTISDIDSVIIRKIAKFLVFYLFVYCY